MGYLAYWPHVNTNSATASFSSSLILIEKHGSATPGLEITRETEVSNQV